MKFWQAFEKDAMLFDLDAQKECLVKRDKAALARMGAIEAIAVGKRGLRNGVMIFGAALPPAKRMLCIRTHFFYGGMCFAYVDAWFVTDGGYRSRKGLTLEYVDSFFGYIQMCFGFPVRKSKVRASAYLRLASDVETEAWANAQVIVDLWYGKLKSEMYGYQPGTGRAILDFTYDGENVAGQGVGLAQAYVEKPVLADEGTLNAVRRKYLL